MDCIHHARAVASYWDGTKQFTRQRLEWRGRDERMGFRRMPASAVSRQCQWRRLFWGVEMQRKLKDCCFDDVSLFLVFWNRKMKHWHVLNKILWLAWFRLLWLRLEILSWENLARSDGLVWWQAPGRRQGQWLKKACFGNSFRKMCLSPLPKTGAPFVSANGE